MGGLKTGNRDDLLLPVWSFGLRMKNVQEADLESLSDLLDLVDNPKVSAKIRNKAREDLKDMIRKSGVADFDDQRLNKVYRKFWDKVKKEVSNAKDWKTVLTKIFASKLREYKEINKYKKSVRSFLSKGEAKSSKFIDAMEEDFEFNLTSVREIIAYFSKRFQKEIPKILKEANAYPAITKRKINELSAKLLEEISPSKKEDKEESKEEKKEVTGTAFFAEADDDNDIFGNFDSDDDDESNDIFGAFGNDETEDDPEEKPDNNESVGKPEPEKGESEEKPSEGKPSKPSKGGSKGGSKKKAPKSDLSSVAKMGAIFKKYTENGSKSEKYNILYFGLGAALANHYGRSDLEDQFIQMKIIRTHWGKISFATSWLIKFNNIGLLDENSGIKIFKSSEVIDKVKQMAEENIAGLETAHKHWNMHKKVKKSKKKNANRENMKRRIKK